MKVGQATGIQIALFMFAVMILAAPLSSFLVRAGTLTGPWETLVRKGAHFALALAVIVALPPLRRFAWQQLSTPVPRPMCLEVTLVTLAKLALAFAVPAALALGFWITDGSLNLDRMMVNVDREDSKAFSQEGLVRLLLAVLLAPIVEEIVFRGFIHRAFARRWGWFVGMLATSILFGLYHPYFWSAFASAVAFTCVLRRTGSLRAPILVHMLFNLMLWWPLLGQHVFPHGAPLSDPATWYFHFACLAFVVVALPIYVWMSRDRNVVAPTVFLEPNAAVPK